MKSFARGKHIDLREITPDDADFLVRLRTDPDLNKHLSHTAADIEKQKKYILNYLASPTDFYFIITDRQQHPLGTIRIYDIQGSSFCWGSWILLREAPSSASIESALLIYDFAFFALHYDKCHFDVRKANIKVVNFHNRFGARIVREDEINYYFHYDRESYLQIRQKYSRYLP
jgi:RimJ/RimL family protein N-acetyltransferase